MTEELKVRDVATRTPELAVLLNRFENLNMTILDLSNEIAFHINSIKRFPITDLTDVGQPEKETEDALSRLEQQLNRLESSRTRLEQILNHVKTIV